MANTSLTTQVSFYHIPVDNTRLLSVRAGVGTDNALSVADALYGAVKFHIGQAIQKGMDSDTAYLCEFAMEAAFALRSAAGVAA